jgi:hypothetical protein
MVTERYAYAVRSLFYTPGSNKILPRCAAARLSSVNAASLLTATQNLFCVGAKRTTKKPPLKGGRKGRREMRGIKCFLCIRLRNLIAISYLVGCRILAIRERK